MVVVECFDLKFDGGLYGGLTVMAVAHSGANSGHGGQPLLASQNQMKPKKNWNPRSVATHSTTTTIRTHNSAPPPCPQSTTTTSHKPQPHHNQIIIKPTTQKQKKKRKKENHRRPRRRSRSSSILFKPPLALFLDLLQTAETEVETEIDVRTKEIRWTHNRKQKNQMNPQPKPQKKKPMKQEWRKMKPIAVLWSRKLFWKWRAMWVESFAYLFVHQYISNDCIGSDGAIIVTRSAYNEYSKRKIAFEERVKY